MDELLQCSKNENLWSMGGTCASSMNEGFEISYCECRLGSEWKTRVVAVGCCNYDNEVLLWVNWVCLIILGGAALLLQIFLTALICFQRRERGLKYIIKIIIARQMPSIITLLFGVVSGLLVVFEDKVVLIDYTSTLLLSISGSMTVSACLVLIGKHLNYLKTRLDFTRRTAIRHQRTVVIMRHLHLIAFATYLTVSMVCFVQQDHLKRLLIDCFYIGDLVVCGLVSGMQYYSTIPIIRDLERMVALQSTFNNAGENKLYKQTADALKKTKSVFRTITTNTVVFFVVNVIFLLSPFRYGIIFYVLPIRQCTCYLAFYPAIILTIRRRLKDPQRQSQRNRTISSSSRAKAKTSSFSHKINPTYYTHGNDQHPSTIMSSAAAVHSSSQYHASES